ncbi:hypothetical protein OG21DRAFT_1339009 [Imleria badia]|nr:hypothetical protein OG21DRAFT_1339009 [Imleria badia]
MDAQAPKPAYTILRIKRKRTEEPLDALVVESRFRRKKTRAGVDVFQFAQTVEDEAWEDGALRQNIQSQISRLAQDSNESTRAPTPPGRETRPARMDNGARRYAVKVTGDGQAPRAKRRPTSPYVPPHLCSPSPYLTACGVFLSPKVISSKDISRNDFRMYDAVLEDQGLALPPMDPEMEKFLPMLQDYLTLQESGGISNTNTYAAAADYVWDVFYRRPYSLSEWNSFAVNYGTVTGLPPSVEDEDLSDNSDSEEEDEADEDSNAEEYYKNDYPDEEDSDNDDGHSFHDATEDEDPGSDHDWR